MKGYPLFFKVLIMVFRVLGIMHIKLDIKRFNFSHSKMYSFCSKLGLGVVVVLMIYNLESLSPSVRNVERFNQYTLLILAWIYLYVPTISFIVIMFAYKLNESLIVENLNRLVKFGYTFRRHLSIGKQKYLSAISVGLLLEVIIYNLAFLLPALPSLIKMIFSICNILSTYSYIIFGSWFLYLLKYSIMFS